MPGIGIVGGDSRRAALFQSASLVHDIATSGRHDEADLVTSLRSILITDPDSTAELYEPGNLRTGLQVLVNQLGTTSRSRKVDIARYVIALMHLQNKLRKETSMLNRIAEGIERARTQTEHFELTHSNVLANLAGTYSDTISQLQPRVMVNGEQQYLSNPDNVNRIRALLLAGMRAAVLWRQLGGSRWQILFKRKRLVETAQKLLG